MSSSNTISFTNGVGSANARVLDNSRRRSRLRFSVTTRTPNVLSMLRRPRTVFAPGDAEGHAGVEMLIWSHGASKAAMLRRPQPRANSEDDDEVLRVKMYESFAKITIFLPNDFHGIVGRVGHSGSSISCSASALYLKDSNGLRFDGEADWSEDQVLMFYVTFATKAAHRWRCCLWKFYSLQTGPFLDVGWTVIHNPFLVAQRGAPSQSQKLRGPWALHVHIHVGGEPLKYSIKKRRGGGGENPGSVPTGGANRDACVAGAQLQIEASLRSQRQGRRRAGRVSAAGALIVGNCALGDEDEDEIVAHPFDWNV
ncbi:hypothetical protein BJV74DRAFT_793606 [Russula compacta]|nr:hypothetical protein BJV74DRAFT_793606 [Russula compacta]